MRENLPLQRLADHTQGILQQEVMTLVALRRNTRPGKWGYGPLASWIQDTFDKDTQLSFDQLLGSIRLGYLRRVLGVIGQSSHFIDGYSFANLASHYRLNIFETVPHALFLMLRTGIIFAGNSRGAFWLGLTQELLFSSTLLYLDLVAERDAAKVLEAYASAAQACLPPKERVLSDYEPSPPPRDQSPDVTITHDFVVDCQAHLSRYPHSSRPNMLHPLQGHGAPSMVQFRGHVTLQPVIDDSGTCIPQFFAIYVTKS